MTMTWPRLYLFAEGQTEQTFANTVLKPHLAQFGVYMHNPCLIAHARKKRKVHRGGGSNFIAMQNDIRRFLSKDSNNDVFFTTMIDLYGLPNNFPGLKESEEIRHIPYERVENLEKVWFEETGDNRFIPFIQLHEFETYLFVNLSLLDQFFDKAKRKISTLQKDLQQAGCPELINDGQHTAPSKRIIEQFPEYDDLKPTVGPQMAELIGLERIRTACPHFNTWLEQLEGLGTKYQ